MILDGKRIADGFQLFVVPASRDIYLKAVEEGIIDKIARSGAMVLGSSCGPCLGVGHVASAGNSRLISTANSRYIGGSNHPGRREIYCFSGNNRHDCFARGVNYRDSFRRCTV